MTVEVTQPEQPTPVAQTQEQAPAPSSQLATEQTAGQAPTEQTPVPKAQEEQTPTPKFDTKTAAGIQPLIEAAGLVPADVAKAITEAGEITPDIMKALVAEHGEGVAGLLKDKLEGLHKSNVEAAKHRDEQVFSQLEKEFEGITEQSGKETWTELATWAKDNVPNDERKEINELLGKGGISAKLAIQELANRFKNSESFGQSAELLEGSEQASEKGSNTITKEAYRVELNKLLEAGHDYNTSPEIKALDRRREKSRLRGI